VCVNLLHDLAPAALSSDGQRVLLFRAGLDASLVPFMGTLMSTSTAESLYGEAALTENNNASVATVTVINTEVPQQR
jgi:hypothetical protein